MSYPLFGLLYSTTSSLLLMLGTGCAINKLGDFFKVLENEENDNFKKAFDKIAGDMVNDFNNSFVSLNLISHNVSKNAILFYELMIGEKFIKKTKDGKIIVDDKNSIFNNYENKIGVLNEKLKDYKDILKKMNKDNTSLDYDISDDEDEDDINSENKIDEDEDEDEDGYGDNQNSDDDVEEINAEEINAE
jgi:hypothetical protein